jgi:hypothetical protein
VQIKEGDKCPYFIYIDVIDWDPIGKNDVIGALMLPLNDFVQRRRIFRSPIGLGMCLAADRVSPCLPFGVTLGWMRFALSLTLTLDRTQVADCQHGHHLTGGVDAKYTWPTF